MKLNEITWLLTIVILILISFLNDEVLTKKSASDVKKTNHKSTKKSSHNKPQIHNSKKNEKKNHQLHHGKEKNVNKGNGNHKTKVSHRKAQAANKLLQLEKCPPTRIIGGTELRDGDMPYTAIYYICHKPLTNPVSTKGCDQWCGGSIISTYHILTAAHCLVNDNKHEPPNKIVVRVGFHNLTKPETDATTLEASAIIIHQAFSETPLINDIALIKVKKAMTFTKFVQPVCLNGLHYYVSTSTPNQKGIIPGWGKFLPNGPHQSRELKFALLTIYGYPKCKVKSNAHLQEFCADSASVKDGYICNGDSGGGLIYWASDGAKNVLLGIASTGGKIVNNVHICGNPMTFTNVSSYADWINVHVT